MPDKLGSPDKPINMKCTTIGGVGTPNPYIGIVTESGDQFYFGLRFNVARMFAAQASDAVASWPVEESKQAS